MSPFIEFNEEMNVLKVLKSSRHGCFEKALGATKHKVDTITYDSSSIITSVVAKIQNYEDDFPHSILVYGGKSTFLFTQELLKNQLWQASSPKCMIF
jgi:hypothetical protein